MGLFGNTVEQPVRYNGGIGAGQWSQDVAAPQMAPQRRGLFGGGMTAEKIALLASGISDAVDPMTLNPSGGGKFAAMMKQRKEEQDRKAQQDAFTQALDPATGRVDMAKFIAGLSAAGGEIPASVMAASMKPEDPLGEQRKMLLEAQIADYEARAANRAPDELDRREQEARIRSLEALANVRGQQEQYYGVKTRQPYAPARPRASGGGGGGSSGLPAGFRLVP